MYSFCKPHLLLALLTLVTSVLRALLIESRLPGKKVHLACALAIKQQTQSTLTRASCWVWNHVVNMVQPPPPIPRSAKLMLQGGFGDFLTLLDSGHKADGDMRLATSFGNDCHCLRISFGVKTMKINSKYPSFPRLSL